MVCPHSLKAYVEQLNELKVDHGGFTPMDNFSGITMYITLK